MAVDEPFDLIDSDGDRFTFLRDHVLVVTEINGNQIKFRDPLNIVIQGPFPIDQIPLQNLKRWVVCD